MYLWHTCLFSPNLKHFPLAGNRTASRTACLLHDRADMTNFFVYMIGVILFVGALGYGASLMGLGSTWIAVLVLAVLGLGVMGAIVKTRQKEPS
jgi:hypothetical protein